MYIERSFQCDISTGTLHVFLVHILCRTLANFCMLIASDPGRQLHKTRRVVIDTTGRAHHSPDVL